MSEKEVKVIPSMMPFYIGCGIMILCTFLLPMYKISSWLISIGIGCGSIFIMKKLKIFKDEIVEIEKPIEYASTEIKELVELGNMKINELSNLMISIDNQKMKEDLSSILQTSRLIIEYIEKNQRIEKDVRKYFRYYLDEIINMVKHYDEFENTSLEVENITTSKEKIEATVANAASAFIKFYNDLYAGKAMDVNVDLKVFDSMLKELG
ncbi:MAG: 5-bromo-4-chloroindolyl phosphate hydrolysis family protein [Traorella sp.]